MKRILEPEYMDDEQEAMDYDAMDHRDVNTAFVERMAELGFSGRILDLGCGPGHIPPLIVDRLPQVRQVTGLDAASSMLTLAERRRASASRPEAITYTQGDAKGLPFADNSFDGVVSNTVLHHIPDPLPFLKEANRVLKGCGGLLIRDLFRPDDLDCVQRLVDLHAGGASEEQRALFHASLCAALTPEELTQVAQEAGITNFEVVVDSDRHMSLQRRPRQSS